MRTRQGVTGRLAEEAIAALSTGNTQALIDFHRRTFGGFVMEDGGADISTDGADDGADDGDDDGDGADDTDDDGDGDLKDKADGDKPEDKPEDKVDPKTKRLNADLARERKERKAAQAELRRLKNEGASDSEKAVNAAVEENDNKWASRFRVSAARAELAAAGVPSDRLGRAVKLLDMEDLEVDDDGSVSGISDVVSELKDEMPELFGGGADSNGKPPRVRTGSAGGGGGKKKSSAERLAASLLGSQ